MCDHEEKMEDDRDWCTSSLAVELSSVESAAMVGFMGMLREPSNKGYDTVRSLRGDLGSTLNHSGVDLNPLSLNHESVHSRGATSGGSVDDSDECSITSYCSVSSSALMNGRMRNRASSGATAPPSSPTASEDRRGPDAAPVATPAAPHFKKTTPAARSYTGNTTTSNSSNNSHTSLHFRNGSEGLFRQQYDFSGAFRSPSPPLSISIPTDRTFGHAVPWNNTQSLERDSFGAREQESDLADDTHMHTSPHPHHTVLEQQVENYRVEEDGDEKEDTGSIASDQSLAVEVESVDEEGTYLSYGGDCEDFAPIVGYSSADLHIHQPHIHHPPLHRSQTEYTVEDPDTPQSYTYGRSVASAGNSPQDRGAFYHGENLSSSADLPPSPQRLRRPLHRKAYQSGEDRHAHHQGDSEASERSDTRDNSASPSSIYERDLLEYQRRHDEGYHYRSTTPNNLHNSNNSRAAESSDKRGGRSINASSYFHNPYPHRQHNLPHDTQSIPSNHDINKNHNNSTNSHKHHRHRRRTLKVPPAHHTSNLSFSSAHSSNNSSLYNTDISVASAVGAGKRKRSSDSVEEPSPHHAPGKKSHTENGFAPFGTIYDGISNNGNNGTSDSTVNVNMRHMYLDSPSVDTH